jgi:2-methylcitrate dehydratase PrpD
VNPTLVSTFAAFVADTQFGDLPNNVVRKAREALLDYLGVAIHGAIAGELSPVIFEMVEEMGSKPSCLVVGSGLRADAALAALANGVASHSIELDDGHRHGTSHPAVAIMPAAMAAAEETKAEFPDLIRAIVLGYEVMLRTATAINPSHLARGFHSTGTCGPLGAGAAAACLYGLDLEGITHAISISGLQGAGFQEMLYSNPMIKPVQPGKAAMAGILSARMAAKGARGPLSLFEGSYGFFKGMTDHVNDDALTAGLGHDFEIIRTYTKMYPTCRHAHCPMDLAAALRNELPGDMELVSEILVETYDFSIREVGQIWHPTSRDEAMFSLPFAVAAILLKGRFTMVELGDDALNDEATHRLADKVKIVRSKEMDALYPEERGARMRITLRDGASFRAERSTARGEPESPVSTQELKEKFSSLASVYLSEGEVESLCESVLEKPFEAVACDEIFARVAGKLDRAVER